MKKIPYNTLEEISKHSNKLIRLMSYYNESNDVLMVNKMSTIGPNSFYGDIFDAFKDDITSTTNMIHDVLKLAKSADLDGNIDELENEEKNLNKLFGDKYNNSSRTLNIGGIPFEVDYNYNKKTIRDKLSKVITGNDWKYVNDLYNIRKNDQLIFDRSQIEDETDAISLMSNVRTIKEVKGLLQKITKISDDYAIQRGSYSNKEKSYIDEVIKGTRAMIDSVAKTSTFITQENGIEQMSRKHASSADVMDEINNALKNSKWISEIEIDQDVDPQKILNVVNQINGMNLNLQDKIVFKVRKLGNYKANGMYLPGQNIVVLDVNSPSAGIHEITHAIDLNNKELYESNLRGKIVDFGARKLDDAGLVGPDNYINYLKDPNEIIARMGEVSFLLNKYNYKEGEDVGKFFDKVSLLQIAEKQDPKDILLSKHVGVLKGLENIYFNFTKWDPSDALEVRDYYRQYFSDAKHELEPLSDISGLERTENNRKKAHQKIRSKKSGIYNKLTALKPGGVRDFFETNKKYDLVSNSFAINTILFNPAFIGKDNILLGRRGSDDIHNSFSVVEELFEYAKTQDDEFKAELISAKLKWSMDNIGGGAPQKDILLKTQKNNRAALELDIRQIGEHGRFIIPGVLQLRVPNIYLKRQTEALDDMGVNDNILNILSQKLIEERVKLMEVSFNRAENKMDHEVREYDNESNKFLREKMLLSASKLKTENCSKAVIGKYSSTVIYELGRILKENITKYEAYKGDLKDEYDKRFAEKILKRYKDERVMVINETIKRSGIDYPQLNNDLSNLNEIIGSARKNTPNIEVQANENKKVEERSKNSKKLGTQMSLF